MSTSTPTPAPTCPIRGHAHQLVEVGTHVQDGTGSTATTWECPTGRYRWFHIHNLGFKPYAMRMDRPRSGWKEQS